MKILATAACCVGLLTSGWALPVFAQTAACAFSSFRSWGSEVSRIEQKLKASQDIRAYLAKELYWAQQDIQKQNVLPSDTVRAAYESAKMWSEMVLDTDREINAYTWCVQCARGRAQGKPSCN